MCIRDRDCPEHLITDAEEALSWLSAERGTIVAAAAQAASLGAADPGELAQLTAALRAFLNRQGHRGDWERLATAALAVATAAGDRGAEAVARLELGTLEGMRHRARPAAEHLRSAVRLFAAQGDTAREARALHNLGLAHVEARDLDTATECMVRALAIQRAAGNALDVAITLDNLALLELRRGASAKATEYCEESLRHYGRSERPETASAAEHILGMVRHAQGRYAEAVDCHRRAQELARAQGNVYREAFTLVDRVPSLLVLGEHRAAVRAAEQGLALRRRLGDPMDSAVAYRALADALRAAGDAERAGACLAEADACAAEAEAGP